MKEAHHKHNKLNQCSFAGIRHTFLMFVCLPLVCLPTRWQTGYTSKFWQRIAAANFSAFLICAKIFTDAIGERFVTRLNVMYGHVVCYYLPDMHNRQRHCAGKKKWELQNLEVSCGYWNKRYSVADRTPVDFTCRCVFCQMTTNSPVAGNLMARHVTISRRQP